MRNFQCHYRVWWCSNWILWIRSDQEITTDHKLSEAPNSLQLLSLWCIWGPVSVNILLLRRRKISWPGSLFSIWEVSVFFVSITYEEHCVRMFDKKDHVLCENDFATSNNRCRYDDISVFLIFYTNHQWRPFTPKGNPIIKKWLKTVQANGYYLQW